MLETLREAGPDFIPRHGVAFDVEQELVRPRMERKPGVLPPGEEAHGVQRHLEFRRGAHQDGPHGLLHALPVELDREDAVVKVGQCLPSPGARFDVSLVVEVAFLLGEVELDPVVKSRREVS